MGLDVDPRPDSLIHAAGCLPCAERCRDERQADALSPPSRLIHAVIASRSVLRLHLVVLQTASRPRLALAIAYAAQPAPATLKNSSAHPYPVCRTRETVAAWTPFPLHSLENRSCRLPHPAPRAVPSQLPMLRPLRRRSRTSCAAGLDSPYIACAPSPSFPILVPGSHQKVRRTDGAPIFLMMHLPCRCHPSHADWPGPSCHVADAGCHFDPRRCSAEQHQTTDSSVPYPSPTWAVWSSLQVDPPSPRRLARFPWLQLHCARQHCGLYCSRSVCLAWARWDRVCPVSLFLVHTSYRPEKHLRMVHSRVSPG
jgi:hypothetical protein